MPVTLEDVRTITRGMAEPINRQIEEAIRPMAEIVVDLRRENAALVKRIERLEGRNPDDEAMKAIEQ